jgi:hypothetical protein
MSGRANAIFPIIFISANSTAIVLDFSCSPCCSQRGIFFGEKTKKFGEKNTKNISVHKLFPLPLL